MFYDCGIPESENNTCIILYFFYFMSNVDDNKPILPYLMLFDMLIR